MGYISIVTHRPRGLPGLQHSGHEKKMAEDAAYTQCFLLSDSGFSGF